MKDYRIPQIDSFLGNTVLYNKKRYIAKPLKDSSIVRRIFEAWSVLTGQAYAVTFYQDRVHDENEIKRKLDGK